jgi:hypothetical protein
VARAVARAVARVVAVAVVVAAMMAAIAMAGVAAALVGSGGSGSGGRSAVTMESVPHHGCDDSGSANISCGSSCGQQLQQWQQRQWR